MGPKKTFPRPWGQEAWWVPQQELPYLVKWIDTHSNLSIQVHPQGKTECWVILESQRPGAGVYLGFQRGVGEEDFRRALAQGQDLRDLVAFYPASAGDFFLVPAGSIHAIGGGISLIEVQQNLDITYRIWDWGRTGRPLHLKEAMESLNFSPQANDPLTFEIKSGVFSLPEGWALTEQEDFRLHLMHSPDGPGARFPLAGGVFLQVAP